MSLGNIPSISSFAFSQSNEEITLLVNDVPYKNFKSHIINRAINTMSGEFESVATLDNSERFPIKMQDRVQVLIRDIPVITGFIEEIVPEYDDSSYDIVLAGRDVTCDSIDSSALDNVSYSPKVSLKSAIEKLFSGNGINIPVIDRAGTQDFKFQNTFEGDDGQNIGEILKKYAKLAQVVINTDGKGNLVIDRASKELLPVKLIHEIGGRFNNILSARSRFNIYNRFHGYVVSSQEGGGFSQGNKAPIEKIISQTGGATDSFMRRSRDLVLSLEDLDTTQTADERARWEANIRRSQSIEYRCEVSGFFIEEGSDILWEPNKLVSIFDERCFIDSEMLIKSVKYTYDISGGRKTFLVLGPKDSFTLQAEQDQRDARANIIGEDFF